MCVRLISAHYKDKIAMESMMSSPAQGQQVKVYCRFRPKKNSQKDEESPFTFDATTVRAAHHTKSQVPQMTKGGRASKVAVEEEQVWTFQKVFGPQSVQQDIFQGFASPCLPFIFEGFTCCLMAYGQTGSGKSHSLIGDFAEEIVPASGILPRCLSYIFSEVEKREIQCDVLASAAEIYNDSVYDLSVEIPKLGKRSKLDKGCGTFKGQNMPTKYKANSYVEIKKQFIKMNRNRSVSSTSANSASSRSHAIFMVDIWIKGSPPGHLFVVDLAGSEEVKGEVKDKTTREGIEINASLGFLKEVIKSIAKNNTPNFRDCKLTEALQTCFEGNAKTSILFNASLLDKKEESTKTFRFSKCSAEMKIVQKKAEEQTEMEKNFEHLIRVEIPGIIHLYEVYKILYQQQREKNSTLKQQVADLRKKLKTKGLKKRD